MAGQQQPAESAVDQALPLLVGKLRATDVFLVYGADGTFGSFGTKPEVDLNDIALWLIYQDLAERGGLCAFDRKDGHLDGFRAPQPGESCDYIAAQVPLASSAGEMLIAHGPWPDGLTQAEIDFAGASLPGLALLLGRRLDAGRAQRQRNQLTALANITRVLSTAEDIENVLAALADTVVEVTGVDYISIDLMDAADHVTMRCVSSSRPGTEQLRERWKAGANRPDPVREQVYRTGKTVLFRDAQNDGRIPESGRNFFIRTLMRSTGVFPLMAKDEVLGVLSVASHRPLDFSAHEVDLLEGLAAQVATSVKAIHLYQELDESRRELQNLNERLQESMTIEHHLARTDPLTGIPNRRYLEETIEAECARATRYGQPLSAMMADLDELKTVNDTYSHLAGDDVLRFLAELARESCRRADVVGRFGGDEFLFILPSTQIDEATTFAERFRLRLASGEVPVRTAKPLTITISIGVAQWDGDTMEGPSCLIKKADEALYQAKSAGRNRTVVSPNGSVRAA